MHRFTDIVDSVTTNYARAALEVRDSVYHGRQSTQPLLMASLVLAFLKGHTFSSNVSSMTHN